MARRSSITPAFTTTSRDQNREDDMEKLLSVEQVADCLGVPVNTLSLRVGPYLRYDPVVREGLICDWVTPATFRQGFERKA
jgi:hypothetical protein